MMDTTPATQSSPGKQPRRINTGIGRLLVWIYGLFALSATARAVVQIATQFHKAPLAYVLSAVSGVIYIIATVCLARSTELTRRIAIMCCSIELAGVIAVGAASVIWSSAFPDATVWSDFGQGYGYVPLILPIVGLWWLLRRSNRERVPSQPGTA
jgi:hypothetical protein